ncbi:hypothetical protein Tco_0212127 [Tanacetum coccineum]
MVAVCRSNSSKICGEGNPEGSLIINAHPARVHSGKSNKIWSNEDVHDLRYVETELPAIVFNDSLTFEETSSCEPTVIPLNDNKINFRISFDEFDDEVIYVNDLKMDSENDNDKVNMPSFPSPKPTVNKTSLSECDEEEQSVLYFNGLFPFNVVHPDDSKSDKDNDDDKIDIKQSSRGNVINTDDGANAQSTAYTTYSLNEYNVFDTGINTAYSGEWIWRIDILYSFRTFWKEIDEVMKVSII